MIDLSKYTKVYEWNDFYGVILMRKFFSCGVIYLIKIGDGIYIDAGDNLKSLYEVHLNLLQKGIHPNSMMSEKFREHKSFEVYILETIDALSIPGTNLKYYIEKYKPDMNATYSDFEIDKSAWDSIERNEKIEVNVSEHWKEGIQEICKIHGLSPSDIVNTAIKYFLSLYTQKGRWELTQGGIVLTIRGNTHLNE